MSYISSFKASNKVIELPNTNEPLSESQVLAAKVLEMFRKHQHAALEEIFSSGQFRIDKALDDGRRQRGITTPLWEASSCKRCMSSIFPTQQIATPIPKTVTSSAQKKEAASCEPLSAKKQAFYNPADFEIGEEEDSQYIPPTYDFGNPADFEF